MTAISSRPVLRRPRRLILASFCSLILTATLAPVASHACVTVESENNDRESQANGPLCSNSTVSGTLSGRDIDWFYFDITGPGALVLSLDHNTGDDFDWALYAETGPPVAEGATSQVPEDGTYSAPGAGRYFVKITRYSGSGWYTLDTNFPSSSDITPPSPPTGLVAIPGTSSIDLDWDDNGESDLDGYTVYRATASGGPFTVLNPSPLTASDYSDSAVSPGTAYLYQVTATDTSNNESAPSPQASATAPSGGATCDYGPRPSKPGGLRVWTSGSDADACVSLSQGPGLLLMGGGLEVDSAFTNHAGPVIGAGDIVVLRTTGSDGYNDYLMNLLQPDSVETLRVDSRSKADSDYVDWAVRSAELVWIAGGDQSDYLNQWQGTRLEAALQHVYDKGGVLGGTSAGHAVMSQFIYDPDGILSVFSDEAVSDPCQAYIHLSFGFLDLPFMVGVINDSHFQERDRMGRLLTFMARIGQPTISPTAQPITGLGIDEDTALYIDANGLGTAEGSGTVDVLRESGATARTQVQCGQPVVFTGVDRYSLSHGDVFDFSDGSSSVTPLAVGIDGTRTPFYLPSNPY